MATMRADERHFFATAKDDLEQGISAVQRHSSPFETTGELHSSSSLPKVHQG